MTSYFYFSILQRAHIISHHAGYKPLEINASDDRTASVLCDRIKQAMESNSSLISQNQRPTCLILDEIDGANDKATMNAIVNIIKADLPIKKREANSDNMNGQKQTKQIKSRTSNTYLRRPIIFIANHKYSPVLTPLLPYARVFDMFPPSEQRLISRIKEILAKEGHFRQTSEQPLRSLVKGSGGDIRSCLHTLQFAASGGKNNNIYDTTEGKGAATIDISRTLLSIMGDDCNRVSHGCFKDERTDIVEALLTIFRRGKQKKKAMYTSNEDKDGGIIKHVFKIMEVSQMQHINI